MKKITVLVLSLIVAFSFSSCVSSSGTLMETPVFDKHYMSKSLIKNLGHEGMGSASVKLLKEIPDSLAAESVSDFLKAKKFAVKAHVYHDGYMMRPLSQYQVVSWATKYKEHELNKRKYYLAHVIEQDHVVMFFYGNKHNEFHVITDPHILVIRDKRNEAVKYVFNFAEYSKAPNYMHKDKDFVFQQTTWAKLEGDILYVSNAHWTYSRSSHGHNGYITAINVKNKQVLWRSQPLVSNAVNFEVTGTKIICSYGFTREEAWVYALDKESGKVIGKQKISNVRNGKKHPEFVVVKGGKAYVKTFDLTEYVLSY
ncbi:MAG: PQQ-like beta-propeller repeat protein [Aureispira sp.]|nr:PQQ-like beta-propeller repeat protein [Aureispira sp.]